MDLSNINIILDVGARDCLDSLELHKLYPNADIYAFECNPETIPICRENVSYTNIVLIEKAISDFNGFMYFYPVTGTIQDGISGKNPGASSLLKSSGKYPTETYIQEKIIVPSITLKTFMDYHNVNNVDILWMDLQGAELMALKGLEHRIREVKVIHTQVEFLEIYQCQPLFMEVDEYLRRFGFELIGWTEKNTFFGNAVYINKLYKVSK